ncbi:hypothetical protein [Brevundimonas sp. AAP58]|uniref:hypothetical protein n=1 Tax=Brevundimonas sp. AAP58 TaxID=1523422 RepID=UPI0006B980D9|nr:hypothetical protein [Brevundimonas sp. AAP58]
MGVSILVAAVLAQSAVAMPDVLIPPVSGVAQDPTCGGRAQLATTATCFVTTQAAISGVIDTWTADFANQQWLAAGGGDNRVVYIRRRDGGGCDGFQIMAFADGDVAAPAAPAYIAMAAIPGDVCAAAAAQPQAPNAPQ